MKKYEFRLLMPHEIEARPSRINKDNSVNLLLYKTSRVDMQLLDEAYGNCGWRITHEIVCGELWTRLEIRDPETGEWIIKEDVGEWSDNTLNKMKDNENPVSPDQLYLVSNGPKARFSDGLKRCGTLIGIGRELYSAPDIYIPANKVTVKYGRCYTNFEVEEIEYDDYKQISYLKIVDEKTGDVVFAWRKRNAKKSTAKKENMIVENTESTKETNETKQEINEELKQKTKEEKVEPKTEKKMKVASREKVDELLCYIDRAGIGRDYVLDKYKDKYGIYTYYKLPEAHVNKMVSDFEGTVMAPYTKESEKEVREFCDKNNMSIEDVQKKANSTDWNKMRFKLKAIENELLGIEIPFN